MARKRLIETKMGPRVEKAAMLWFVVFSQKTNFQFLFLFILYICSSIFKRLNCFLMNLWRKNCVICIKCADACLGSAQIYGWIGGATCLSGFCITPTQTIQALSFNNTFVSHTSVFMALGCWIDLVWLRLRAVIRWPFSRLFNCPKE